MSSTAKRWVDTLESHTYWLPRFLPHLCSNETTVNTCLDYIVFAYILDALYVYVCVCVSMRLSDYVCVYVCV